MAKQSDNDVNLNFLKAHDDKTASIVLNAGQSALYEFLAGKWIRKNIEGTLFVVKRTESPLFKIIIPNKLPSAEVDIFEETITDNYDINLEEPYALCKNADGVINCFWFYNKKTCKQFESTIKQCVSTIRTEAEKKHSLNATFSKMMRGPKAEPPAPVETNNHSHNATFNNSVHAAIKPEPVEAEHSLSATFNKMILTPTKPEEKLNNSHAAAAAFNSMILGPKGEIPQMLSLAEIENDTFNHIATAKPAPLPPPAASQLAVEPPPPAQQQQQQPQPGMSQFPAGMFGPPGGAPAPAKPLGNISPEELKQSLVWLLQNDADFLFTVYETYKSRISQRNNHH